VPFLHWYDLSEAVTCELPGHGQVAMMNGGQLHAEHRDNHG
jgi:hypothetical protein